tara:strand:+ start:1218 stop:1577 length:360 start_codon:yes stop_codon:yes gene_type:complete
MKPTTILLICMLILAIAGLFCGKCIEKVHKGGSAIGYNMSGININDRRSLRNDSSFSNEERDYVMNEIVDPITGGSKKVTFGGDNPALYAKGELDYKGSYFPHQRFPKANIGQVLATDE